MDKLSLYFITWNVATRPPGESVRNLLDLGRFPLDELPDFYFIGLQEVKSQPQNFVLDALLDDPWTNVFKHALSPHDYVKVKTVRLVGILLNVFCLRKHLTYLRNMESGVTRTGLMGLWGNKGATSLRLELYGVNLCVTNAHFAAHDHMLKQRINDYNTVIRDQTFMLDKETTRILYHDYVFFIGDLNFRLNNADTYTQDLITDKIRAGDLAYLLEQDQLVAVMRSGEAFSEFNETRPTFQPTFKYQFNSHNYDNKRRCAWTDRILYKVNENNYEDAKLTLEQLRYTSLQDYGTSDHKPVLSEFKIKICPTLFASGCLPPVDTSRLRRDTTPPRMSSASVSFDPIVSWVLDRRNNATLHFGGGYIPSPWDWIGVFPADFASLTDYLCYIYLPLPLPPNPSTGGFTVHFTTEEGVDIARAAPACSNAHSLLNTKTNQAVERRKNTSVVEQDFEETRKHTSTPERDSEERREKNENAREQDSELSRRKSPNLVEEVDNDLERTSPETSEQTTTRHEESPASSLPRTPEPSSVPIESLVVPFPDSAIRTPGSYRLVYFTKRSSDVLGISNAFEAVSDPNAWSKAYNLDW